MSSFSNGHIYVHYKRQIKEIVVVEIDFIDK